MRFHSFLSATAFVVLMAVGLGSCTPETAPPGSVTGTITVMNANPGYDVQVDFSYGTTAVASVSKYSLTGTGSVTGTPSVTVNAKGTDGSLLASTDVTVDSTKYTWAIFTGSTTDRQAFTASNTKVTPAAGEISIRFINAAPNTGGFSLKLNSQTGANIAQNISAKSSSTFSTIPASTTTVVVTDGGGTNVFPVAGLSLVPQASYSVVLYGSKDVSGTYGLKAQIVREP